MKPNLMKDVENNNKFYRYVGQRERPKRMYPPPPPLIIEKEEKVPTGMEKAEVLNEFFDSVFAGSQASHASYDPETRQESGD